MKGAYCKDCGGCGDAWCDGISSFLINHVKGKTDCKYEEDYIRDIISAYEYLKMETPLTNKP